ncbi:5636_t:CDS:2, partial [Acaulospora morrowiae]
MVEEELGEASTSAQSISEGKGRINTEQTIEQVNEWNRTNKQTAKLLSTKLTEEPR